MTIKSRVKLFPSVWAILQTELTKLESVYADITSDMIAGLEKETAAVLDISATGLSPDIQIIDNVGVLRIEGVITQKADIFTMLFGGATLDTLTNDFNTLLDNEGIDTIVLDIDSPGGTVSGVQDFANLVFDARNQKKIITISSSIMTSAAMWIGAAAEHVLISGGTVTTGSIGVLTTHVDTSVMESDLGIKTTEITAGKYKRIASTHSPLTDVGRSELQSQVDKIYEAFIDDVARFRGVSEQEVRSVMADGKIFIGDNAIKAGLVDEMKNFDLLIETINNGGLNMGLFAKNKEANIENLRVEHEELYIEAVAVGADAQKIVSEEKAEAAKKASFKAGSEVGIKTERERIQGIQDCTIIGHEELAKTLIADGKTSPGEAAIKMINANKEANAAGLDTIKNTSAQPVADEAEETVVAKDDMTAKEKWDSDAKLAKEFDSFEAFEAVEKNADNFRVLRR
ncbi:MAG: S49 family peptidase [Colwellia sp.]|nr:S49 family peptidase [Colwellia sp.]